MTHELHDHDRFSDDGCPHDPPPGPVPADTLAQSAERSWERNRAGYQRLAGIPQVTSRPQAADPLWGIGVRADLAD